MWRFYSSSNVVTCFNVLHDYEIAINNRIAMSQRLVAHVSKLLHLCFVCLLENLFIVILITFEA